MPPERQQIISFLKTLFPFHKLNDLMVGQVASTLKISELPKGKRVYSQNNPSEADSLCIVFSGSIRLTRGGKNQVEEVAVLGPGEIFGYEILQNNLPHPVNSETLGNTILFRLDRGNFRELINMAPEMAVTLKILLDSYLLRLKIPLSWRNADEVVQFIARKHWFFLVRKLALPSFLGLITLPAMVLFSLSFGGNPGIIIAVCLAYCCLFSSWLVWSSLDWSNDVAIITNQRVLVQEKVMLIYESRQEAPLTAVLSVAINTGQIGRILNFGDVIVRTYAGSIQLSGLSDPQNVASFLELQWGRIKTSRDTTEQAILEDSIRHRLGIPLKSEPLPDPTLPAPVSITPGAANTVHEMLAALFNLRVEEAGEVTYHTHWIILLKKVLFPSLSLIGVWLLLVCFLYNRRIETSGGSAFLLAIIFSFGLGLWWLYQLIDWRNDTYVINQEQILDYYKKPLGKEEKKSAPLKNVQSVRFERKGLMGLLLNFGSVVIMVGEAQLIFNNVYNPSDVQREIFKRLAKRDYSEKLDKMEADQKWVGDWISAYHSVMQDNQRMIIREIPPPPKGGGI